MRNILLITLLLVGQQPAPPAFDVATIKPNDGVAQAGRYGWEPGGRYHAVNLSGTTLLRLALGTEQRILLAYQLVGAPGWLSAARYDIAGKLRSDLASADRAELARSGPQFLRSLLEDRFKLRVHHEVRDRQRYRLARVTPTGALGLQLHPTACQAPSDTPCKAQYGPSRYVFEGVTMARLSAYLSGSLNQIVVDDTGLVGRYDLDIEWSLDPNASDDKPSIFTALQEQLGLKLQTEHGPVDVVVIDRIERPTLD